MDKDCQHLDNVIRGGDIKIHSDHKNLKFGNEMRHTSQRALRSQTRINEVYGADVSHTNGNCNVGSDRLSRLGTKAKQLPEEEVFMISKLDISEKTSNESCLNLNLFTFNDAFLLDLGYVARHKISDQKHKKIINARTDKQGKGPALGETTIRKAKLKTNDNFFCS